MEVENKMGIVVPCLPRGFSFRLQPLYASFLSLFSSAFIFVLLRTVSQLLLSGEISAIGEFDSCGSFQRLFADEVRISPYDVLEFRKKARLLHN